MDQDYNLKFFSEKTLPYLLIAFAIAFAIVGWVLATGTSKTQGVRLVDIFIYGPYLTYLAFQEEYVFSMAEKIFLLFLGATTVSYNARNFLKV
jgi:hypothetical protein